jgi:hypothetical protein
MEMLSKLGVVDAPPAVQAQAIAAAQAEDERLARPLRKGECPKCRVYIGTGVYGHSKVCRG